MSNCAHDGPDNHSIPDTDNAWPDTSRLENELRGIPHKNENSFLEQAYRLVFDKLNEVPKEPDEDDLLCRYLSPEKFLNFCCSKTLYLSRASDFSDPWECNLPEARSIAVQRILNERNYSFDAWTSFVKRKAACWVVSCWTGIAQPYDDHLLWSCYAGSTQGVGITVRYGVLKKILSKFAKRRDLSLASGLVNYDKHPTVLLPFCKDRLFRNEREVRFAFTAPRPQRVSVSPEHIFNSFGLRICRQAPEDHYVMVRDLWEKYGGNSDNVHCTHRF